MSEVDLAPVKEFLESRKMAVISTISDGKPQSALVGFVEDGLEIYFQTRTIARKAANLELNPNIALVIGHNFQEPITLQYEGAATKVTDPDEITSARELFVAKESPSVRFFDMPDVVLYKVKPTWLRFSDYSQGKPQIIEHTF